MGHRYQVTKPRKNRRVTLTPKPNGCKEWWIKFLFDPCESKGALNLYRSSYAYRTEKETKNLVRGQKYIIHPFSTFRWIWDIFVTIELILALVVQPLEVAFFSNYVTTCDLNTNRTTTSLEIENSEFWNTLSIVLDAILSLDILITFRTAYIDHKTEVISYNTKIIAIQYLKGCFLIDFLTSIPLAEIFGLFISNSQETFFTLNALNLMKAFKFIKILRILRLVRYVHILEDFLNVEGAVVSLFHLIFLLLFFLHWNACVQYLVPLLQQFPPNTWVHKYPLDLREKDKFFRYSVSLYRASNGLMCSGWAVFPYSEFNNQAQIWTDIVTYMIGRTFYIMFVVAFKRLGEKRAPEEKRARAQTEEVKAYMHSKELPKCLRRRVTDLYSYIQPFLYFDQGDILYRPRLPNDLREEILLHSLKAVLKTVPFLESNSEDFLDDILTKLKFQAYMAGEVIVQVGKRGKSVFFIDSGIVEVLDEDGNVLEERGPGEHFGETSLLLNQPEQETVVAQEACDIYELGKEDFLDVLEEHPYVEADFLAREDLCNILADLIEPSDDGGSGLEVGDDTVSDKAGSTE